MRCVTPSRRPSTTSTTRDTACPNTPKSTAQCATTRSLELRRARNVQSPLSMIKAVRQHASSQVVTAWQALAPTDDERLGVVLTEPGTGPAWAATMRFALAGHFVVIGAPTIAVAEQAAKALRNHGAAAFGVQLDLTDWASINAFARNAAYLAGPVDVLIDASSATPIPSCPDTSELCSHSVATQHLAARLLDTKPQRPQPDLLIVRYRHDPDQAGPEVNSSAVLLERIDQLESAQSSR